MQSPILLTAFSSAEAYDAQEYMFSDARSTRRLLGKETVHLSLWGKIQKWRVDSKFILVGWRWGIKLGLLLSTTVLVINTAGTLGIVLPRGGADSDGKLPLMSDNCERVKMYNAGYHLIINVLSTLLLGSSNYAIQCLTAPTRADIDKAHAKGIWLDIGISIFVTLYAHSYDIYTVNSDFSQPDTLNQYTASFINDLNGNMNFIDIHNMAVHKSLSRLSRRVCIEEFGQPFQSRNNLLLLVVVPSLASGENPNIVKELLATPPLTRPEFYWECTASDADTLQWLCQSVNKDRCRTFCKSMIPQLLANETWAPFYKNVDHCLVNRAEQQCTLNFSLHIMIIVIIMNACKRPSLRRRNTITRRQWMLCISVCLTATLAVGIWFACAIGFTTDSKNVWNLGFGSADPRTLIYGWAIPTSGVSGIIANALIANFSQPLLSLVYFTYNTFLTAMISASEWDNSALFQKGLRVSGVPRGEQRATHFLQLPYRYSIPLMGFSTLLHWLISQSIFVVSVVRDGLGSDTGSWITCGYALTPMLVVFLLGFVLIGYAFFIGQGRLRSNIPISLSNSKNIATECHPEPPKEGNAYRKLQWGPRRHATDGSIRYAFSSALVDQDIVGGSKCYPGSWISKMRFRMSFQCYKSVENEEVELQQREE